MATIEMMAETFKLLSDKTRLTIIGLLKERELCVCNVVDILEMSQPSVSQHLRKMKAGGLVKEIRRGKWTYYSLTVDDKPYVKDVINNLPSQAEKIDWLDQQIAAGVCE